MSDTMNRKRHIFTASLASAAMVATMMSVGGLTPTGVAVADDTAKDVTSTITGVRTDSIDANVENSGAGGSADFAIDGNVDTYWHTKWQGGVDPLPHYLEFRFDQPTEVSRLVLTPRQSSNGSGRVHDYQILASADCYGGDAFSKAEVDSWKVVASGSADEETHRKNDLVINIPAENIAGVKCMAVKYLSAFGGLAGNAERVGSLAELHVWTGTATSTDPGSGTTPPPATAEVPNDLVAIPNNAITLTDGDTSVRTFADVPAVVDYRKGDASIRGTYGTPVKKLLIGHRDQDGNAPLVAHPITVGAPATTDKSVTYPVTVDDLNGVSMDIVYTLDGDVLTVSFKNIKDADSYVNVFSLPNPFVSVISSDPASQLSSANVVVNRALGSDHFEKLSDTSAYSRPKTSWMSIANNSQLAAGLEGTMVIDGGNGGSSAADIPRFDRKIEAHGDVKIGTISPHMWVYRAQGAELGIGVDDQLWAKVKITGDANSDGTVDWQDGAIATRDIYDMPVGADEVKNLVVARIPFNIVSQARHPFLRTLDDTKRISLATDNLGQQVLLKGYQAEGHDAAHPDYGGHYNVRAGGLEDLKKLITTGKDWNATFGVHINAVETYSEAKHFGDTIKTPHAKAWNWMNQAYRIDYVKDIGTRHLIDRLQQFREEVPDNLHWLYFDTHFPYGWQNTRLVQEMNEAARASGDHPWRVSSEWAATMVHDTTWSHWASDEAYGSGNKGYTSQIMRFVLNTTRDTWNPNSVLGKANVVEFEGWTNHKNYQAFIDNVWQMNVPTKFLQRSPIVKWEKNKITFENGTVASSPRSTLLTNMSGADRLEDRTISYKGVEVYKDGTYLFPWTDGGSMRMYHYNRAGGQTTWSLNPDWSGYANVKVYTLTDNGRADEQTVAVTDGQITLDAKANTAYVVYPGSKAPAPRDPKWGEFTGLRDPGFYSGTLQGYTTNGDVKVEYNDMRNRELVVGPGAATVQQPVKLQPGDYSYWAYVNIEVGKTRPVTIAAVSEDASPAGYQPAVKGVPQTTIIHSGAYNFIGSDEKHDMSGNTRWQRMRVTFHLDKPSTVYLSLFVGDGDAEVRFDDQRLVNYVAPTDSKATDQTILFEDFENVDTGYWPFLTGQVDRGDARTQLAERNEPYSQAGWDDKPIDNVLDGKWSLLAHEEGSGLILRTAPQTVQFQPGHKYRVSFDYQAAYAEKNGFVVFSEFPNGTGVDREVLSNEAIPVTEGGHTATFTHEFATKTCNPVSVGINHQAGGTWNDLAIDNFRVEDLGAMDEAPACATLTAQATTLVQGKPGPVTATVVSGEDDVITNVVISLTGPAGWKIEPAGDPATELKPGESTMQKWNVTAPKGADSATLTYAVSYTLNGEKKRAERTIDVIAIDPNVRFLSDMPVPADAVNGWGPIERDMSNGETLLGDGTTITIGKKTYPKGLGVHAHSSVTYPVPEGCTRFKALAGADAETGRSTVSFQVKSGAETLFGPVNKNTNDEPAVIDLDVTGKASITLIVGDGGNGVGGDHADWAMARFVCPQDEPVDPTTEPTMESPEASAETPEGTMETVEPTMESPEATGETTEEPMYTMEYTVTRADAPRPKYTNYTDVRVSNMFAGEIQWVTRHGILRGWRDQTFRRFNGIHRDAVVTMFWRIAGEPKPMSSESGFTDVPRGMMFHDAITWAKEVGLTKGWDDGTFRPTDNIQRQAFAAMLQRFCKMDDYKDKCARDLIKVTPNQSFKDVPADHEFVNEVGWVAAAKISTGWKDGTFRPYAPIKRDAAAAFIYRAMNNKVTWKKVQIAP